MRHLRARSVFLVLLTLAAACSPSAQPSPTTAPAAAPTAVPAAKPTTAAAAAASSAASPVVFASPSAAAKPAASPAAAASPAVAASPVAAGAPNISITGGVANEAKALNGAGGTFPAPLYQKWFDTYAQLTQVQVNYQAIGSGGGIQGIQDQTIDFGASDAPMTDDQLKAAKGGQIFHIPTALGAIVPTYNIEGVTGQLKFSGATLAGIYLGSISKWNDPLLVADNPQLAQINQDIVPVHRSDGSGTTFGFTDYLSAVSPDWSSKIGKGTSVNWPVGLGGSGNPGVAGEVQQNPNSIGYVELIYALQNNLAFGQVKNKAGQWITPSLDGVTAAAGASLTSIPADLRFSIVDAPGDTSYPISTATWILAYQNQTDPQKALALTRLLWWATHDGQKLNNTLQYAVVPAGLTAKSEQFILQISVGGKPVLTGQ
jgi:phosphate transport system substrate-binding protein